MSYTPYFPQRRVKFQDALDDDYVQSATPIAQIDSKTSRFGNPRFPNLQMMFRNRSIDSYNDGNMFGYYGSTASPSPANGGRGVDAQKKQVKEWVEEEEDVDMEASEFIKRKHRNLQLQKLTSTKLVN